MYLKDKARNLPLSPGVYLMKDSLGNTIYVGKSKKLKMRVQSYFHDHKSHSQKVKKLVKNISDFEVIHTDTEFEAFLLENQLIKQLKPFFNSRMKSPQNYPYILIQTKNKMREIIITNHPYPGNDPAPLIFGPYTSKNTVVTAIHSIKEFFQIDCSQPSNKNVACLNYSLGLCLGMCLGGPAVEQYEKVIDKIIGILNGTDNSILEEMKQKMNLASENLEFKTAAKYRNYLEAVQHLIRGKKVIAFANGTKNIIITEPLTESIIKVFYIKGNQVLYKETYDINRRNIEQLKSSILFQILSCYNGKNRKHFPKLDQEELDDAQIIYSYLKNSNCRHIVIPQKWLDEKNIIKVDQSLNKWLTQSILKMV
ncbi:GIY-YIG nuclease family protein [Mesobacillus maritimus]|uniref:GIY-YIG nuclease family protein n=1 Tax=Mesobacillus maritimus TaxID=1643336 RepID=A0ABS7K8V7_9BACI|nr:GIY-YIG nuclease family protein [Mesobacillus maritimus]MBY0098521.1 GIY-YIG nuclease family protein [Mesobacillus maritimus]